MTLAWINSTGSGASSLHPEEDGHDRFPLHEELYKRCKYFYGLQLAFGWRAIPKRIYLS
jgi:hypothetical protein